MEKKLLLQAEGISKQFLNEVKRILEENTITE